MRHSGATVLATLLSSCGAGARDVELARAAEYGGDFETVFVATRDVLAERFVKIEASAPSKTIKTAWQKVGTEQTPSSSSDPILQSGGQRGRAVKLNRYFVRFDVTILGGPPWHVRVEGHASTWAPDAALPVDLPDSENPAWLQTRTDSLVVAIHKRLDACCAAAAP